MDPKATLAIINDPGEYEDRRREALHDLADWIVRGGFMPTDGHGEEMHPTLTDEAVDTLETGGGLAASRRVALAYGDLSGLCYLLT